MKAKTLLVCFVAFIVSFTASFLFLHRLSRKGVNVHNAKQWEVYYSGFTINVEEFYVENPTTGDLQRVKVCYRNDVSSPPAIIFVPGRNGDMLIFERLNQTLYAASKGFLTITFDPLGRGLSEGQPNDYGRKDQAILKVLYDIALERGSRKAGFVSMSFGIAMVSGFLADYDLPVEFWVDWEGPCDRIFAQCYCGEFPSREAFRRASDKELDEARARIIKKIKSGFQGPRGSCYDNEYWAEREVVELIKKADPRNLKYYVRLQSDVDHVQPNYDHSIMMINTMVSLGFNARLNYGPWNLTYSRESILPFLYPREPEAEAVIRAINIVYQLLNQQEKPYPIYVTIVMHNEEPPTNPNFADDKQVYLESRNLLVKFSNLLAKYDVPMDWQSEWCFLEAVRKYDQGDVTANTDGLNVVQYLNMLGFSIDPHAHETKYNYADVATLIRLLGVEPSSVVGGFLYYPPDNEQGWEKFRNPIEGVIFPNGRWTGRILWGASTKWHKGVDLLASGVWRPKDRYHFIQHDPEQPLIYIGSYRRELQILGGVPELVWLVEEGRLEPGRMYTASVFVAQMSLSDEMIRKFEENVLIPLKKYEEQGYVRFATLPEIAEIWIKEYDGIPCIWLPENQAKIVYSMFPRYSNLLLFSFVNRFGFLKLYIYQAIYL